MAAHLASAWRVASLGSGGEFGGVLRGVLASLDAELACADRWHSSIKPELANRMFFYISKIAVNLV
jgi:hypothetical protein